MDDVWGVNRHHPLGFKQHPLEDAGIYIIWVVPPPRIPVANEGLGWDSLLKM